MTLQDLIKDCPPTLTIQEAANIMSVTPRFLQIALQQNKFPFGIGVQMDRWAYYINTERFINYMTAKDMKNAS